MKRINLLGLGFAAAVLLTACSGAGGAGSTGGATDAPGQSTAPGPTKPITVHVAETAGVPSAFLNYGVDQGFFEKEGLDIVVDTGAGGAAAIPGIIGGTTDLADSNVVSVILAKSKGLPLKIVAPGTFGADIQDHAWSAVLVSKDSPIKSAADLAGKTIAVNTLQNIGDVTIKSALEQQGINIEGIKFVEVGFPNMLAALSNGNVDAVWEIEPFMTSGLSAGDRAVLYPYVQAHPGLMIGSFVATESYIAEHPDVVKAFQRGFEATVNSVMNDPDGFREALPELAKIPEAAAQKMQLPTWKTQVDVSALEFVEEHMQKYGISTNKVDVSAMLSQ